MVNVELLQYWLELVSVKPGLSLPNCNLSLPNWAVIVLLYGRKFSRGNIFVVFVVRIKP